MNAIALRTKTDTLSMPLPRALRSDDGERHSHSPPTMMESGCVPTFCRRCRLALSVPRSSSFVECPSCGASQEPGAPLAAACPSCGAHVCFPPHCLTLQCPACARVCFAHALATHENTPKAAPPRIRRRHKRESPQPCVDAFAWFCRAQRDATRGRPDGSGGGDELRRQWKALEGERRAKFEALASADAQRYESQRRLFEHGCSFERGRDFFTS